MTLVSNYNDRPIHHAANGLFLTRICQPKNSPKTLDPAKDQMSRANPDQGLMFN